nr:MAG TPA: Neck appendage protein [Caudoviricetes sp.]
MPLNAAYADEIVQEDNSTYQLSFRFPTSDPLWEKLKEETFLTADDLHGEQDFVIFEVEKKHGYIQVYANQVFTLLNNYVVNPISLDRQTGSTALSRFAGSITRDNPFSFFSDIEDRHSFNIGSKNAMEVFAKDKHSIIGQWGGDLVRHGYQVRLLKNGGSENESLFMYKKNLSSYQHKTSTKSLKTRITFKTTVKGEGEKAPDRTFTVIIDSPLINKYSQIYEDVIEVNDQDVKDEASLRKYGEQYFRTTLCDMMEDSLELEVVGQSDVPVQMFDVVSIFHERYNLDVRKKITKYTYSPMAKKLKSIGFGQFQSGLANAIGNAVSDAVKGEAQQLQSDFERQLARELKNADLTFERQKEELVNQFTDDLNATRARAEEVKRELSDTIDQRFSSFDNGPLQEIKNKAIEALRNAGASSLLAQEAKRIGLDSVAKLEEFKRQATSAQTTLAGDLDVLKLTIANNIRPKQAQAEAEIAKQVEALVQTKKELAGVKSAQATYEETTTRRLSELTNLANGKASKSELTQTAEQLASKIASVQVGSSRNYFRNSRSRTFTTGDQATYDYRTFIVPDFWKNSDRFKRDYVRISFDVTFPVALANDTQANVHFGAHPWYGYKLTFKGGITERQHFEFTIDLSSSSETYQTNNVFIRFGTNYGFPADLQVVIENAMLSVGNYFPAYQSAYEDQEDRVSTVESNFRQRADALDAGVNRLTEGLRSKADISSLNVTAENIRQSVKSLETSTKDKLDQKLSLAEFEVRAGSIRQEILNATKDKADKTLVVAEAGKLREEFSKMKVGGRNYAEDYDFSRSLWQYSQGDSSPQDWTILNGEYNVKGTTNTWKQMQIYSKEGSRASSKSSTALLDLEIGETYTLSFQGICYSGSPNVWVSLRANRTAPGNPEIMYGNFNLTSSWQTYQITIPALTKPDNFDFWRIILGYNEIGHVAFRKVELTRSSTRIDAGPAPEDGKTDLVVAKSEFEKTAEGLSSKLATVETYVSQDGQRQDALQRYTREESARQANAVRELVTRDYVGKATYQEDVRGLERRLSAISTQTSNDIATKIAQYKQTVDGQFLNITSQIAGKANQTDFQRVQETSQLYERIIGSNENDISNRVARMAVTNQIFQVEVGKYGGGGPNLVKNSDFKDGMNEWTSKQNLGRLVKHGFYHNSQKDLMRLSNSTQSDIFLNSPRFELERNTDYVLNFRGFNNGALVSYDVFILGRKIGETSDFSIAKKVIDSKKLSTSKCEDVSITFNSGEMDNAYIRFDNNGSLSGTADLYITEVDLYKGYKPRPWQPHPEDIVTDANAKLEATQTKMTQLAGSWAVQNLTSAGALVSGLNLGANGHNRLDGKLTHITGETLIDKAVIKSAMIDKLKTANFEAGSVTTVILDAEAVTAEKLKVDQAFFNKLVANEAYLSQLFAKQAFINRVQSVAIDASQVRSGILSGDRIYGGTIRGAEINGTRITGDSRITIGDNGFLRPTQYGGLQINVPETFNASKGIGVQLLGKNFGEFPKGMFIYNSPNWNGGNLIGESVSDTLLTVKGLTSLCNLFNGKPMSGLPINSNFRFGEPVPGVFRVSFIAWDPRYGQLMVNDGTNTKGTWWFKPDPSSSDKRLKVNIQDTDFEATDFVKKLEFKQFDWKPDKFGYKKPYTNVGLIAQDVEKLDSSLVYSQGENLALDDFRLGNIALKAIQELSQRIETLERKLA